MQMLSRNRKGTAYISEHIRTPGLSAAVAILSTYILYRTVVTPFLGLLRPTQIWDTGVLTQFVNVGVIGLLILFGPSSLRRARSHFQTLIVVVALQAVAVGAINYQPGTMRDFLAHIVHLASAFVMFNVGKIVLPRLDFDYWHRHARIAVVFGGASFAAAAALLAAGLIVRFTVPAESLLIPVSFFVVTQAHVYAFIALGVVGLSAKRGVIVAAAGAVFLFVLFRPQGGGRALFARSASLVLAVAVSIALWTQLIAPQQFRADEGNGAIAAAAQQTLLRWETTLLAVLGGDVREIDRASAGRFSEVDAAARIVSPWTIAIGNGAGTQFDISPTLTRHYVHTSPLALSVIYGLPFALIVYGVGFALAARQLARTTGGILGTFAAVLLAGTLIRSFFDYTIFIDLLTFSLIGYLHELQVVRTSETPVQKRTRRGAWA
jgi:hypothetical protein